MQTEAVSRSPRLSRFWLQLRSRFSTGFPGVGVSVWFTGTQAVQGVTVTFTRWFSAIQSAPWSASSAGNSQKPLQHWLGFSKRQGLIVVAC